MTCQKNGNENKNTFRANTISCVYLVLYLDLDLLIHIQSQHFSYDILHTTVNYKTSIDLNHI